MRRWIPVYLVVLAVLMFAVLLWLWIQESNKQRHNASSRKPAGAARISIAPDQWVIVSKDVTIATMHFMNDRNFAGGDYFSACHPKENPFHERYWKIEPLKQAEAEGRVPCIECWQYLQRFGELIKQSSQATAAEEPASRGTNRGVILKTMTKAEVVTEALKWFDEGMDHFDKEAKKGQWFSFKDLGDNAIPMLDEAIEAGATPAQVNPRIDRLAEYFSDARPHLKSTDKDTLLAIARMRATMAQKK